MQTLNKKFPDGFLWVKEAFQKLLPKAGSFILTAFLATLVFYVINMVIGFVGGLFAIIPILGWIIALCFVILMFWLTMGFTAGYITAIQQVLDNGSVTFASFFDVIRNKNRFVKLLPFSLILFAIIFVVALLVALPIVFLAHQNQIFLTYAGVFFAILVFIFLGIYSVYALIVFLQREEPRVFDTLDEAFKGLRRNILPIIAMYLAIFVVAFVISLIGEIPMIIAIQMQSMGLQLLAFIFALFIATFNGMIGLGSICVSAKEIFVENNSNDSNDAPFDNETNKEKPAVEDQSQDQQ